MRAIEFKTKIRENKILIPRKMQPELITEGGKSVRVIVFVEESDVYDDKVFRQMAKSQFLKGYSEADAVYDL